MALELKPTIHSPEAAKRQLDERAISPASNGVDSARHLKNSGSDVLAPESSDVRIRSTPAGLHASSCPLRKADVNAFQAGAGITTLGPLTFFESRTSTSDETNAASTHSVALPPLYDDLNHLGS